LHAADARPRAWFGLLLAVIMANSRFPETCVMTKPRAPIDEIYAQLKRGLGHEHVTDANVHELIGMAQRDGHPVLAEELREWQAPCRPKPPVNGARPS
jgi:hypothetical protein